MIPKVKKRSSERKKSWSLQKLKRIRSLPIFFKGIGYHVGDSMNPSEASDDHFQPLLKIPFCSQTELPNPSEFRFTLYFYFNDAEDGGLWRQFSCNPEFLPNFWRRGEAWHGEAHGSVPISKSELEFLSVKCGKGHLANTQKFKLPRHFGNHQENGSQCNTFSPLLFTPSAF